MRGAVHHADYHIGLDLAKHWFQVHGVDADGRVVVRRRLWRSGVIAYFRSLEPCLVGMEACATVHYWARELMVLGHTVKLMPPAYVKAYVKRNKNAAADAEAICEAVTRPSMIVESRGNGVALGLAARAAHRAPRFHGVDARSDQRVSVGPRPIISSALPRAAAYPDDPALPARRVSACGSKPADVMTNSGMPSPSLVEAISLLCADHSAGFGNFDAGRPAAGRWYASRLATRVG